MPETTLNVSFSGSPTKIPTLVFLHFWGGSSLTFSPIITLLSPNFQCIAIDQRGWGLSSGPQNPDSYSIGAMAEDIEDLIPKLGIADFVLVGHSMGGKVAQLIAGRRLVRDLKGAILIAPAPPTPLELPPDMRAVQIAAYATPESAEHVVRNVLSASDLSDRVVQNLVEDMVRGNAFARDAWPMYGMGENIVEQARNINTPVLVITAELDRIEPVERVESEVLGNIQGAEMVVIKGSGHLIPVEATSKIAEIMRGFLDVKYTIP